MAAPRTAESMPDRPSPSQVEESWPHLRERVLAALEEDPLNEARIVRDLDRRGPPGLDACQRVLAALTGATPARMDARRILVSSLELCRQRSTDGGRPTPLRLSLLEVLLLENRRRRDPFLTEIRLGPAPSTETVADATHTPTAPEALRGAIQAELRRARRFDHPATVLRLRLDAWEDLCCSAGTALAARSLAEAAILVKNEIRDVDWVGRTEDHDLLVFLSGTGRFGALLVAKRISSKLREVTLPLPGGAEPATVSIGIAAFPEDARFAPELLSASRLALFRARAQGGGAVSVEGRPSLHSLLRVPAERVRIVVRRLDPVQPDDTGDAVGGEDTPREGILFRSPVSYDVGVHLELDCIEVRGFGQARLRGRVVRLEQRPEGDYEIGVACALEAAEETLLHGEATE